uniref:Pyridoxal phosphate homeostasis protein n=1 Tax=Picocystis salinarum TaxID=88271 RepID=A0A7S3UC92_9CHLO
MEDERKALLERFTHVKERVEKAEKESGREVRLVAVSKTKPTWMLEAIYDAGQRHFGENYVQELLDKAEVLPKDIQWHMIGHLQSNKAKQLVHRVRGLSCVETVDSAKLATVLDRSCAELGRPPLRVFLQVNTSEEASKFGVNPDDCVPLAKHVVDLCPHLRLAGLMTIGKPDYTATPENFHCLVACREAVCSSLGWSVGKLDLSMGMSSDYELAISLGSTNVRVGSTIFGSRNRP